MITDYQENSFNILELDRPFSANTSGKGGSRGIGLRVLDLDIDTDTAANIIQLRISVIHQQQRMRYET